MSKPWFWLGAFLRRVRQVQRAALDAMAQKLRFGHHGVVWIHVDSKNDGHKRKKTLGLRKGNVFLLDLSPTFGDAPQIAGAMLIPYQDSYQKWLLKRPRSKANFGCEFEAHMTRVGRQGGLHPPVFSEVYIRGSFILNPDCWWWRRSSSSSDGLETRLEVSINIILFAFHLDIHRWWFLSDFGGSIVFLEHEEMEQTDAIELGAHRGYASILKPKN